jgi:hypothetical protein
VTGWGVRADKSNLSQTIYVTVLEFRYEFDVKKQLSILEYEQLEKNCLPALYFP